MKRVVNPAALPPPFGFSHGILSAGGRLLFLAGQTGSDAQGRIVAPDDLVAQFEQALRNLRVVVEEAGGTPADIVQLTIFVRSRDDYVAKLKPIGRAYRSVLGSHYPAMGLFEVSGFFQLDALVEIQGVAVLD